jgi:fagellar hook-basal body proteins
MIRSLYSGITGLKNHQIKMDVIANNISNVNTVGFKRSRASFSTQFSQTLKEATDSMGATNISGTNPVQIGLGVGLGSIDQLMTQGPSQSTGSATDMMIQGNGMFVLDNDGTQVYTRNGAFGFDKDGKLIDPSTGAYVQGVTFADDNTEIDWESDTLGPITIKLGETSPSSDNEDLKLSSFAIDKNGVIMGVYTDGTTSETHKIAQLATAKFNNYAGLKSIGGNYYISSSNSGDPTIEGISDSDAGSLIATSALEMSNVDLSQEFTDMIVTQRGFQANSRVITVSDSLLQELVDLKRQ